jgi:hypothetical protein
MKKIIIFLMAVSIILTSCGKSAGLSNRNKGADNKTLSATGAGKKQLPQGTNYKNSSKKSSADTIKEYWHTTSDFFCSHKIGIGITAVLLIVSGLVYFCWGNMLDLFRKKTITSIPQIPAENQDQLIKITDDIPKEVCKLINEVENLKLLLSKAKQDLSKVGQTNIDLNIRLERANGDVDSLGK